VIAKEGTGELEDHVRLPARECTDIFQDIGDGAKRLVGSVTLRNNIQDQEDDRNIGSRHQRHDALLTVGMVVALFL